MDGGAGLANNIKALTSLVTKLITDFQKSAFWRRIIPYFWAEKIFNLKY
jgi:hypothetical protein